MFTPRRKRMCNKVVAWAMTLAMVITGLNVQGFVGTAAADETTKTGQITPVTLDDTNSSNLVDSNDKNMQVNEETTTSANQYGVDVVDYAEEDTSHILTVGRNSVPITKEKITYSFTPAETAMYAINIINASYCNPMYTFLSGDKDGVYGKSSKVFEFEGGITYEIELQFSSELTTNAFYVINKVSFKNAKIGYNISTSDSEQFIFTPTESSMYNIEIVDEVNAVIEVYDGKTGYYKDSWAMNGTDFFMEKGKAYRIITVSQDESDADGTKAFIIAKQRHGELNLQKNELSIVEDGVCSDYLFTAKCTGDYHFTFTTNSDAGYYLYISTSRGTSTNVVYNYSQFTYNMDVFLEEGATANLRVYPAKSKNTVTSKLNVNITCEPSQVADVGSNSVLLDNYGSLVVFIPTEDGKYAFYTNEEKKTTGTLYDANKNMIAISTANGENGNYRIEQILTAGEVYFISSSFYQSSAGDIDVIIEQVVETELEPIKMNTVTLNLSGQIGVNFKVTIPEDVLSINGAYAYMTYDGRVTKPMKVLLTDAIKEGSLSVFTFPVAVMEYAEPVSIKFFDANDNEINLVKASNGSALANNTYSISAKTYGDAMKAQGDAKLNELLNSLEDFGKCAQILFNYKESSVITPTMDAVTTTMLSAYKPTVVGSNPTGISKMQASLNVESINKIILTCYFASEPVIGDYTFTVDGVKVAPIKVDAKTYIVQVDNISSKDLDKAYAIKVEYKDGTAKTVNYSALSYAYGTVDGQLGEGTADLSKALYWYNKAADMMFE